MKRWIGVLGVTLVGLGALGAAWLSLSTPEVTHYTVVRGDTLGEIAAAHGVTVDDLRRWNGISGDLIEVGDRLAIYAEAAERAVEATAPRRRTSRSPRPATPVAATLSRPRPKPCLSGPTGDALGEVGTVASEGLSYAQIKSAMDGIAPHTLSCVPEGLNGRLETKIVVGCDGIVRDVETGATGGLPTEVVACITERLAFAEFPAHALPDGEIFEYPLTYSWD